MTIELNGSATIFSGKGEFPRIKIAQAGHLGVTAIAQHKMGPTYVMIANDDIELLQFENESAAKVYFEYCKSQTIFRIENGKLILIGE